MRGILSFLLAVVATAQNPQERPARPQPPAAQPAGPPGAIRGQVIGISGDPLRKAEVTVRSNRPGGEMSGQTMTTDSTGVFAFDKLPPGTYMITVQRNGYVVNSSLGARGPRALSVTVAAGQSVTGLSIKMTPHSVITGRVVDEDGEPVARAMVQVLKERNMRGKRQMMPMNGDNTDDLGEFRIHSLMPGRYYVSAAMQRHFEGPVNSPRGPQDRAEMAYATIYYPGAMDLSQATMVDVNAGQEARGIDFKLHKIPTARVRGRVLDETGKPAQSAIVMSMPAEQTMMGMTRGSSPIRNAEGTFELAGLPPGNYILMAHKMGGREDGRFVAMQPVTVGNRDLEGVEMNLTRGFDLSGTIKVEGDETIQPANIRVMMEAFVQGPFGFTGGPPSKPDGTFQLQNVMPAKYRASVGGMPEGTYLKAVKYAGQDVLESGFTPSAGGTLEVVLGSKSPQVTGVVKDEKGEPVPNVMVTLVPASTQRDQFWRYANAMTDQNGSFTVKNLAPGEYKAFAYSDLEEGAFMSPDFVKQYETRGHELKLKEGSTESVTLKVLQ